MQLGLPGAYIAVGALFYELQTSGEAHFQEEWDEITESSLDTLVDWGLTSKSNWVLFNLFRTCDTRCQRRRTAYVSNVYLPNIGDVFGQDSIA